MEDEGACGNLSLGLDEECDDGNLDSGDGCDQNCLLEPGFICDVGYCWRACGDGTVGEDEVCEPTRDPYCSADCSQRIGSCGDGDVQANERCDTAGRGCSSTCQASLGWICDPVTNTCAGSGLDPATALATFTEEQLRHWCNWTQRLMGGVGEQYQCRPGGTPTLITVSSVDECVEYGVPVAYTSCTVAQMEDWVAEEGSPCAVVESSGPPCAT